MNDNLDKIKKEAFVKTLKDYGDLLQKHSELTDKHIDLHKKHIHLQDEHVALQKQFIEIQTENLAMKHLINPASNEGLNSMVINRSENNDDNA